MRNSGGRRTALAVTLFLVSVSLFLAGALALVDQSSAEAAPSPQDATPAPAAETIIQNDQQCLDCHTAPDQVMTLDSGETLYLTIDADRVEVSAHGEAEVGCRDCHTDITAYPHAPLTAGSLRAVTISFSETCAECHEEQAARVMDSIHAELRAQGNLDAATCADCHNPHYQVKVEPLSRIPATCARCHSGIMQEYRLSVHGAAVMEEENADAPLCITCHGVHTIQDPTTAEWLSKSPQLCAGCHADPERMAPYGLNTDVLTTYVADFHGTTATLFEKQTPDQLPNTPLCIDCHGIHNIKHVDDAESSVIKDNLLTTCQQCHPNATENFSDAWLSHYVPSPEHNPLVYYVGVFYQIFVPATVGGMALFVVSDLGRQVLLRRKGKKNDDGRVTKDDGPPAPAQATSPKPPAPEPPTPPAAQTDPHQAEPPAAPAAQTTPPPLEPPAIPATGEAAPPPPAAPGAAPDQTTTGDEGDER